MDKYCILIKRSKGLTQLLKYQGMMAIIRKLHENLEANKVIHDRIIKTSFICIIIKF